MAVPAPAIPTGNAYTVHVARPEPGTAPETSALVALATSAAPLIARWKIPVRMHVSGDAPEALTLRGLLAEAGARASAFSPAPSGEIPGEGFWKTTVIVVEGDRRALADGSRGAGVEHPGPAARLPLPAEPFWALPREDRKVEWEPLCLALATRPAPGAVSDGARAQADLWCVSAPDATPEDARAIAADWRARGAGAVAVLTDAGAAWDSGSSTFGQSSGYRAAPALEDRTDADDPAVSVPEPARLGAFAAGLLAELIHDLLSENLFDKTLVRADRECLGMRPLRLGRAVDGGVAAVAARSAVNGSTSASATHARTFVARTHRVLNDLRGPASKPWPGKGR